MNSIWRGLSNIILNFYFFIPSLILIIIFCSLFNFRAETQTGLIPSYIQYSNFFKSGFDLKAEPELYTFPIWGYGFVLMITSSKTLLILLQQFFTCITILILDKTIKNISWKRRSRIAFRLLVLGGLPWFFFHTVIWPYSWGANLLMLGMIFLLNYLKTGKLYQIIISGVMMGIMLNFRSDYLFLILFYFFLLMLFMVFKFNPNIKFIHISSWILIIFFLLIPWSQYAKLKTGHRIFTTTNKGHFLFISLGQLDSNIWNIEPFDTDSTMRALVNENVGSVSTESYEADKYLTHKWLQLIKDNPKEFLRKCVSNFQKLNINPFYRGELWVHGSSKHEDLLMQTNQDLKIKEIGNKINEKTNTDLSVIKILNFEKRIFKLILFLMYFSILLFFLGFRKYYFKDCITYLFFSIISYQFSISIFAYYTPAHNTNLYMIYLLWIIYVLSERPFSRLSRFEKNLDYSMEYLTKPLTKL